jgi:selenocysteine-specific elongation factor
VRDVARITGVAEEQVRQLFKRLARAGELYPVAHDHYYTDTAVAELAALVRLLGAQPDGASIATLRDALSPTGDGGGRKIATQILEFFDRVGYTRRVKDHHVLRTDTHSPQWLAHE